MVKLEITVSAIGVYLYLQNLTKPFELFCILLSRLVFYAPLCKTAAVQTCMASQAERKETSAVQMWSHFK